MSPAAPTSRAVPGANARRAPDARLLALALGLLTAPALASDPTFGAAVPVSAPGAQLGADWLYALDMDGDSDPDLLSSSNFESEIVWYRNDDGLGQSWSEHVIDATAGAAQSQTRVVDMDGDGDLDVAVLRNGPGELIWRENLDGSATSWTTHTIVTGIPGTPSGLLVADLDADGDPDVVSCQNSGTALEVVLHENLGGSTSWAAQVIAPIIGGVAHAVDIDGDGDLDMVGPGASGAPTVPETYWFENLGGLSFALHVVGTSTVSATRLLVGDIDGDGDIDLAHTDSSADEVVWSENADGVGGAWIAHTLVSGIANPQHLDLADVDGDLDLDMVYSWHGVSGDWGVMYLENDLGDGSVWSSSVVSTDLPGPTTVRDMDRDGDPDVAQWTSSGIVYQRNDTVVDLGDGLAGTGGLEPRFKLSGSLEGDSHLRISLTQGHGSAVGHLVVGLGSLGLTFKGGTLVPTPDLIITVGLGPEGIFAHDTSFPPGVPAGTPVYTQAWLQDPAGPAGFSASNALLATTP